MIIPSQGDQLLIETLLFCSISNLHECYWLGGFQTMARVLLHPFHLSELNIVVA